MVAKVSDLPWARPFGRLLEEHGPLSQAGHVIVTQLEAILNDQRRKVEKTLTSVATARVRTLSRMSDKEIMEHFLKKCQCVICTDRSGDTPNPSHCGLYSPLVGWGHTARLWCELCSDARRCES